MPCHVQRVAQPSAVVSSFSRKSLPLHVYLAVQHITSVRRAKPRSVYFSTKLRSRVRRGALRPAPCAPAECLRSGAIATPIALIRERLHVKLYREAGSISRVPNAKTPGPVPERALKLRSVPGSPSCVEYPDAVDPLSTLFCNHDSCKNRKAIRLYAVHLAASYKNREALPIST